MCVCVCVCVKCVRACQKVCVWDTVRVRKKEKERKGRRFVGV